jgi:hypothetical protein
MRGHAAAKGFDAALAPLGRQGGDAGPAERRDAARHRLADREARLERGVAVGQLEKCHARARVRRERNGGLHVVGKLLHRCTRRLAQFQRAEIGLAETHHGHAEREAAVDPFEVAQLGQRVGQAHHGRTRQAGACRELADAQAVLTAPVTTQHREATRQGGDELRVFMLRRGFGQHRGCVRIHVPIRGM